MALILTDIRPERVFADIYGEAVPGVNEEEPFIDAVICNTGEDAFPKYRFTMYNKDNKPVEDVYYELLDSVKAAGFSSIVFSVKQDEKEKISKIMTNWLNSQNINAINNPFTVYLSISNG